MLVNHSHKANAYAVRDTSDFARSLPIVLMDVRMPDPAPPDSAGTDEMAATEQPEAVTP